MRIVQQFLTQNDCYRIGKTINVKGVCVHSTGANNPYASRYVPGNDVIGYNKSNNHWNKSGITKCVHAFIGKFADGEVGTVQTLPWNRRGWHAASGYNGSANDTHIGFEICEDGLNDATYFNKVYKEAVELVAMLCKSYNLNPLKDGVVICHQEGYRRGIASNHADVLHWFPKFGKSMDDFRKDVYNKMKEDDDEVSYDQWKSFMEQYRKELSDKKASSWAVDDIEKCIDASIFSEINGSIDRPQDLITRQEVAVVASSILEKSKK